MKNAKLIKTKGVATRLFLLYRIEVRAINPRNLLIKLAHCKGAAKRRIVQLFEQEGMYEEALHLTPQTLATRLFIPPKNYSTFIEEYQSISTESLLNYYKNRNIHLITIIDSHYPTYLKHIFDPPPVLFCQGDISLLKNIRNLSVVGTRHASKYGCDLVQYFVTHLAKQKFTIISGLALGIDAKAHWTAIEENSKTIAVIAGGFDHIYPKENMELAKIIQQEHLLLSEHPPYKRPEKWMFPMRNRIISGLSLGTFVAQASKRSGSLITAQHALEQGRIVFSPPVPLFDPLFQGNIQLLKEGAALALSPDEIIEELKPMYEEK